MPSQNKPELEICVDSVESAIGAEKTKASRIELCSSLFDGGITPPLSLMQLVRQKVNLPIHIMIRPRRGDFLYSDEEFELMKTDIAHAKQTKAEGVVFGILKPDGSVDVQRTLELIRLAKPLKVTFHRAFDMSEDPFLALEELVTCGMDYLLTSGQRQTAEDGLDMIRELVKRAAGRIKIIAASGINAGNVKLLQNAGVNEFHFTARKKTSGKMQYRNEQLISMGQISGMSEYESYIFDDEKVINVRKALE